MFTAKAKICGIMANPVGHSMSPLLHRVISESMGVDLAYIPLLVAGDLETAVKGAYALGFSGMNVSIPYKQSIMPYLVQTDEAARVIGAVNTLVRCDEAKGYKGYNTDMPGLEAALQEQGIALANAQAVVLGCGGAARAVLYLCIKHRVKSLHIFNRRVEKARENIESLLCALKEAQGCTWEKRGDFQYLLQKAQSCISISIYPLESLHSGQELDVLLPGRDYLVFQTTGVGMHPHGEDMVTDNPDFYDRCRIGIDLVYTPLETAFMKAFYRRGRQAVSGLDMLLYQGLLAWEHWNEGRRVDEATKQEARQAIRHFLEKKE